MIVGGILALSLSAAVTGWILMKLTQKSLGTLWRMCRCCCPCYKSQVKEMVALMPKAGGFPLFSHQRGQTRGDDGTVRPTKAVVFMQTPPTSGFHESFSVEVMDTPPVVEESLSRSGPKGRAAWKTTHLGSRPGVWSAWGRRSRLVPKNHSASGREVKSSRGRASQSIHDDLDHSPSTDPQLLPEVKNAKPPGEVIEATAIGPNTLTVQISIYISRSKI